MAQVVPRVCRHAAMLVGNTDCRHGRTQQPRRRRRRVASSPRRCRPGGCAGARRFVPHSRSAAGAVEHGGDDATVVPAIGDWTVTVARSFAAQMSPPSTHVVTSVWACPTPATLGPVLVVGPAPPSELRELATGAGRFGAPGHLPVSGARALHRRPPAAGGVDHGRQADRVRDRRHRADRNPALGGRRDLPMVRQFGAERNSRC